MKSLASRVRTVVRYCQLVRLFANRVRHKCHVSYAAGKIPVRVHLGLATQFLTSIVGNLAVVRFIRKLARKVRIGVRKIQSRDNHARLLHQMLGSQ